MTDTSYTKNIVITGATGGLGRAVAIGCAEKGARLLLIDKNLRALERLCDEVEALGAPAPAYCQLDLASAGPENFSELTSGFIDAYGEVRGLVHCAAEFEGLCPLDQISPQDWLLSCQTNLNSVWLLTITALPSMKMNDGRIVFVLDHHAAQGKAYWGAYGVTKAALRSLAQTFAEELDGSGCSVHSIEPGPMRTDLRAAAYIAEDPAGIPEPSEAAGDIVNRLLD